ncbi:MULTISPECIES: hypothetical protein [Lactobacillus]|uniref:hypothetical protein n=1 Tax=Lactobacillus TaxID=1578 RepID=UPI000D6FD0FF|nr:MULTISPECIES: hypothetical protein [Lactobacillus]AWN32868.1 hypothetical protein DLD54_01180 [Lactobacillus helsingborgensis]RMC54500.1 hypothetical protein F5ESL0262_01170 [Lactobacillus sp. ESL0262]
MFATVFYWIIIAATGLWGVWSAAWSMIYVAKHENGNLWIFAIINVLILALLGLANLIYSTEGNQWYWFSSTRADISLLVYMLFAYCALVVLQVLFGITRKPKKA